MRKKPCRGDFRQGFSILLRERSYFTSTSRSKLRLFSAGLNDQTDSDADDVLLPYPTNVRRGPIELWNAERKAFREIYVQAATHPQAETRRGCRRDGNAKEGGAADAIPDATEHRMNEGRDLIPAPHHAGTKQELVGVHGNAGNGFVLATEITDDREVVSKVAVRGGLEAPEGFPQRRRHQGRWIGGRHSRARDGEATEHFRLRIDHLLSEARDREEEQPDSQKDHSSHFISFSSER